MKTRDWVDWEEEGNERQGRGRYGSGVGEEGSQPVVKAL